MTSQTLVRPEEKWVESFLDANYEISINPPHRIRLKGSKYTILPMLGKGGYYVYMLTNCKKISHHKLVATQFVPNPDNKPIVDHIDGNITNNDFRNLRWVNERENELNTHSYKGVQFEMRKEITESMRPLDVYDNDEFDHVWIDIQTREVFWYNGILFKLMKQSESKKGEAYVRVCNVEGNKRTVYVDKAIVIINSQTLGVNDYIDQLVTTEQKHKVDYMSVLPLSAKIITQYKQYKLKPIYWYDSDSNRIIKQNNRDDVKKYRCIRSESIKLVLLKGGQVKVNVEDFINHIIQTKENEELMTPTIFETVNDLNLSVIDNTPDNENGD